MIRREVSRAIGFILDNTPRARHRRQIEDHIRQHLAESRPIYARAEEAKARIFTVTLPEYAASQGRAPTDYLIKQLTAHASDYAEELCLARSLCELLDQMEDGGFEAIVSFQPLISHDHSFARGTPPVDVTALGTALKLKDQGS